MTILATAIGEESFADLNGNNVLDDSDVYEDRAEAFRDDNENGVYDVGTEEFRDFNSNNLRDPGDNQFNGTLCNASNVTNVCSASRNIFVDDSLVIVMAGSSGIAQLWSGRDQAMATQLGGLAVGTETYLYVFDVNGQPMPVGTNITLSTDNGVISSRTSFTVPETTTPISSEFSALKYPIIFVADDEPMTAGTLTVDITSPGGVTTTYFFPALD